MYTNVLHKLIQLSVLSELLVQCKGVAMTTAPEKAHWITPYRKLSVAFQMLQACMLENPPLLFSLSSHLPSQPSRLPL